jgi:2',3'-cyclic-nucleotide 2'-phosphodiesterase (5'-nucleotidase family)
MIRKARRTIAPLAERRLGHADRELTVDRVKESPLADAITDAFREACDAEVAFVNTGGLRTAIPAGEVTYEHLFRVIPFNNHGVVIGPMSTDQLLALLQRSVETCGTYGSILQSGLKVSFRHQCDGKGVDKSAKLIHVETVAGEVLFDASRSFVPTNRSLKVATLDFLAAGGSGYDGFKGVPLIKDLGIIREVLARRFERKPAHWTGAMDGRWQPKQ